MAMGNTHSEISARDAFAPALKFLEAYLMSDDRKVDGQTVSPITPLPIRTLATRCPHRAGCGPQ